MVDASSAADGASKDTEARTGASTGAEAEAGAEVEVEAGAGAAEPTSDERDAFFEKVHISYQQWVKTLASARNNNLLEPSRAVLYQDMTQPLSQYFMASSHNTYLEGDQLTSASSTNRSVSTFTIAIKNAIDRIKINMSQLHNVRNKILDAA
jgi:hypothetical protein